RVDENPKVEKPLEVKPKEEPSSSVQEKGVSIVPELKQLPPHLKYVFLGKDASHPAIITGMIYLISDSAWVSPVHVVPKKGGMIVVRNDKNELILSRTVTRWRLCIDYRWLNSATRKDHFPCLSWTKCDPEDQEKTAFMCPFGVFAYRRMPFGLCNAPATFQRCMLAIFSDMMEDTMEVFMDDFSRELCLDTRSPLEALRLTKPR
ncbi:reverse transcriptase, partial [Trifolium medium]|nr:reverse transcriptase [Trifolium medium]